MVPETILKDKFGLFFEAVEQSIFHTTEWIESAKISKKIQNFPNFCLVFKKCKSLKFSLYVVGEKDSILF